MRFEEEVMKDPVENFLASYPSDIKEIARELRTIIRSIMPEAHEAIYHDVVNYSLSASMNERLVYLAMLKNYVRLGFMFGGYLPDPDKMLVGEGKRLRHIKVSTLKEAQQPALKRLIQAAWTDGRAHIAQMKEGQHKKIMSSKRSQWTPRLGP